ncbi:patatin-like phospholipase family protein [Shewanella olleyana]|uniref:patatin-like phospholipase family protein n=1 Tax=Shewanella olleyana TaxID=135626 RepID=UPI00200EEF06|nr:patatin-like phospholipase family protein [Shewanella olleyana]MCL1067412.1 patatin-like phospholipase family protein [Shewanella olleyana]
MLVLLTSCATHHPLDERVPTSIYQQVSLSPDSDQIGNEPYRFWASSHPNFLYDSQTKTTPLKVDGDSLNILALSGGGANGAYGVGVLNGLADSNSLPEFTIITGISAGSLIAPFIYTQQADGIEKVKEVILNLTDKSVLGKKNYLNALLKDAFSSGDNIFNLVEATYTDDMIAEMAVAHKNGKRLFIGTTHFDSGKAIIWNIGEIASSDLPNKHKLIHQILTASASIPGVFPPQFFNVYHEGNEYEELHVDGGLGFQMFFDPSNFNYEAVGLALGLETSPNVYIIRNGTFDTEYKQLADKGTALLSRSLENLIIQQSRGDLYRIMYISKSQNIDIHYTYIQEDFTTKKQSKDMFDKDFMKALYDYGYQKAKHGDLWISDYVNDSTF